jgi:hypothetical protein
MPGPTNARGIDYVRSFSPSNSAQQDCRTGADIEYEFWLGKNAPNAASALVVGLIGNNRLGLWLAERVGGQVNLFNHAGRSIDAVRRRICFSVGPTLRLYHVKRPGTSDGFSKPFASSTISGFKPLWAFDGAPTHWMPSPKEASDSFVGFDFGAGGDQAVRHVRIDWANDAFRADTIEIQYADFGGEWTSAGIFNISTSSISDGSSSVHELPNDFGPHRLWRVIFRDIPEGRRLRVREVRFLNRKP